MKRHFILSLAVLVCGSAVLIAQDREQRERRRIEPRRVERRSIVINGGGSYLGVYLKDVTAETRSSMKLADESGALITRVDDGSPAAEAGLKENDVVVRFDGETVRSVAHLRRLIGETPPGRKVDIDVIRAGHRQSLKATLREREGVPDFGFNFEGLELDSALQGRMKILSGRLDSLGRVLSDSTIMRLRELDSFPWGDGGIQYFDSDGPMTFMMHRRGRLGVELQSMSPQLAKYFGVSGDAGALIGAVADSSPAAAAGLQAGDVIVAIDGKPVTNPADAVKLIRGKDEGTVDVRIVRDRREQTIPVTLPKQEKRQLEESFFFGGSEDGCHRLYLRFHGPEGTPVPPHAPIPPAPPAIPEGAQDLEFSAAPHGAGPATTVVL